MKDNSSGDSFERISQESADEILSADLEPQFETEEKVVVSLVPNTEESFHEDVDSKLLALTTLEAYFLQNENQLSDVFTSYPPEELIPSLIQFNAFTMSMFAESTGLTIEQLIAIIRKNLILSSNS